VRHFIGEILRRNDWEVTEAGNAEEAFEVLQKQQWKLVFCDVLLGGANGYEVLKRFKIEQPNARIVLITGYGSAAGALDATNLGAYDYLVKPFSINDILRVADEIRERSQVSAAHSASPNADETSSPQAYVSDVNLIGQAPEFVKCLKMVGRVAAPPLPVLITGESGTGKEIVARAIHSRSQRSQQPFVAVNCGAIPVELIESELFGHVRGAFSGAERDRVGLWEEADGGTIFLDEITETSPLFQVKLLRVLQQGEIRRVGSNQTLKVDVRVIAASNRKTQEEGAQGRFRQDLMYRLNAVSIDLPPLRERAEDIHLLARHFAAKIYSGETPLTFSQAALGMLKSYHWRGNVRELENAVFHAVSLCDEVIYPEHLPIHIQKAMDPLPFAPKFSEDSSQLNETDKNHQIQWLSLADVQALYVAKVLAYTGGNKREAARLIGIDRKTLSNIAKRLEADS
jgi:two-component system response regulator AtoC